MTLFDDEKLQNGREQIIDVIVQMADEGYASEEMLVILTGIMVSFAQHVTGVAGTTEYLEQLAKNSADYVRSDAFH